MKPEQKESFEQELLELVRSLEAGLLQLEESADSEHVAGLFRHAHNIKSAAAMLGLSRVSAVAHQMETVLEEVRNGRRAISSATISQLLAEVDSLIALLAGAESTSSFPTGAGSAASLSPPTRRFRLGLRLLPDSLRNGLEPLRLLEAVAELGQVVTSTTGDSQLPNLEAIDPERLYLTFELVVDTATSDRELRNLFLFAEGAGDIELGEVAPPPATPEEGREPSPLDRSTQTLLVSVRRVDALVELATELSAATAQLEQLRDELGGDDRMQSACAGIRRLASRIHEAALTVRLVPVAPTFTLLRRYVRDQALRLHKSVEMVQRGETTEVDKIVAERLFDPLKHLVRNALDHGIETPAERQAKGKPGRALLFLEARQEHGRVVLDVGDDGRGLDLARIRQTARARGLIAHDAELTDAETSALIFLPGFSTAEQIGELSGRGVGLDVVNRSVLALGGDLRVTSLPDAGVTFTLSVPLTLAMIEGLVLCCDGQRLVVPLDVVRTLVRPQSDQLTRLPGGGEVLRLADAVVPLVRLNQVLGLSPGAAGLPRMVVVATAQSGLLGLCADEVLAQESVLLKGFHRSLRIGPGVLAAAVISDGSIALVLDLAALDKVITKSAPASAASPAGALMRE